MTADGSVPARRRLTGPGFTFDMTAADYFADPCPSPSLTQSIAKILIDQSPAHAFVAHPRLNPKWEANDPTKFDLGNIAHALLLKRGKEIVVIPGFDDWKKKEPRETRDALLAEGKHGVLEKDYELGVQMVAAALAQLAERGLADDWAADAGDGEVVIAANLPGIGWARAMIDWLAKSRRRVWDYKTTKVSAAPHSVHNRVVEDGWDIQAAMHERILAAIDPANAGKRQHFFVIQECEEPHALSVVRLPEAVLTMGRKRLAYAERIWTRCTAANTWPRYPTETLVAEYPSWAEARWLERETQEDRQTERPPQNLLAAG